MDNWCILAEAENVNAAYAWINFILQPDDLPEGPRVPRLQHRHQGRPGVGGEAADLPYLDLVFFDEAQVATFEAGAVNSATETTVKIWDEAKAKAGT